jgi:hypothetical protein
VTVVGGPVVPRPPEGWTTPTAEAFCADYIRQTLAAYLYIFIHFSLSELCNAVKQLPKYFVYIVDVSYEVHYSCIVHLVLRRIFLKLSI